ncbi:MAG TPA: MarR family transcriptional regulator [Sphaerochaeta sp.]|nr:MarR family transcriptional regulator [Sphaerochaeta sp.]
MQPTQNLDESLSFALYVCSKEIIQRYKVLLEPFGLTYTSYLVLLALWEEDAQSVKELGQKLYLDSGTLSPVLKRLEAADFVIKEPDRRDERSVSITLTAKGRRTQHSALSIPKAMHSLLTEDGRMDSERIKALLGELNTITSILVEG